MPQGWREKAPHFWGPSKMNTVANEQRTRGAKEDKGGGDGQTWGKAAFSDTHPAQGSGASLPVP